MGATYIFETAHGTRLSKSWHLFWTRARRKAQRIADKEGITVFFYDESKPSVIWDNHSDYKGNR